VGSPLVRVFYPIETLLKVAFIVLCPFNVPYTLVLALLASVLALLRVTKRPQLSKEYLGRVLMNNHGQNLLYVSFGAIGFTNYLYYAPMVLFFFYGIVEFVRLYFPSFSLNRAGDLIRYNKWWVYEGKCRLEIFFCLYCILSLPFDFMNRGLKCFIMVQFLFIKFRISPEFQSTCSLMHAWVDQKTSAVGPLNALYRKVASWVHSYATRELVPPQQAPPASN
jgi:hypothetical protein